MSLEALSYRGIETLDKIQGTERGILLGSSISLDFKNTRVAIGHLGNVISQGKVTVSSLIDADSNTWQTSKIITEPSASNGSYFGHAVSMNWSGTRVAVGAYGVDKVYVFDATSTSSNPWATYVSNTISGYTDSNFGYSVSLGQDIDTTLAIGAPNHNRVDVWKLSNSSWSLAYSNIGDDIPNVIPLNSTSGTVTIDSKLSSNVSSLQYGFSCKLAPFGNHLIVGAPGTPLDAISSANSDYSGSNTSFLRSDFPHAQRQSGSVRVFTTTDDWVSTVSQLGQTFSGLEYDGSNYITNSGNLFFPTLGYSVAINFDGSVIAVSAPNRQGGTVRVYEYSSVSSSWEQRGVDITSASALMTGFSIGLDYTGNRIAMSMISNWSFQTVLNALLYVLDWSGSDWIEAQVPISSKYPGYDYNSNEGTKMLSGYRLDITDGNQVAVSRIWWDDNDFQGDDHYTGSGGSVPLSTAVTTFPANQNAYGRVEFYFFLITATFTGNSIFEGYVTVRELRIGPNDNAIDNTIPKRISFGGTAGDNYYDETIIENRVITGNAAELLLHKNHQTNETIDRVRIKASEIHLDHMRMYHSVYQGGQESKNVQSPRFILDQFGTIAIGNLYSGNDSTSLTTSLAETYLDIKAETQIRDKLNVNYPGRTKLLKSRDYTFQGYSPSIINTRCADLIGTNIMYDDQPGAVRVYSITNQGNMPYRESEKAFEFTGTTSGIGQSDLTGVWTDDDASMMFWLKLKDAHSNYTSSNVLCSWGGSLSTNSNYNGGCLQLTSTGLTLNFGSGIGTASTTYTFTPDTWYHICVVFPTETTTADGKDYIYINNQNMTLTKTYSTNPYPTWPSPNFDSQGWRFGYGEASGSIPGPAGIYMGMMIFNISWGHGGNQIKEFSYNNGSPSECLCVGGDAHIQNKLGVGTLSPTYEIDVNGTISSSNMVLASNSVSSNVVLAGGSSVESTPYYFYVIVENSKFGIDGTQQPTITLYRGVTYRFDQSSSTNGSHPFRISTTAEGGDAPGTSYNGSNGSSGSYRQYIVPLDAPDTMYYNCSAHSGMGGTLKILSGIVTTSGVASSNVFVNNHMGIGTNSPKAQLHVRREGSSGESNVYIQSYSDATGDQAALFLGTPHANSTTAQPKCAIIADAVGWSRANLHFCLEGTANNGSAYRASTSNSRMMIQGTSGRVGIGTTNPTQAKLVVSGSGTEVNLSYGFLNSSGGTGTVTSGNNYYSIFANQRIACSQFNAFSDSRIKKNVVDINDSSALDKIRLLEPKIYNYIDEKQKGTSNVYGFIAQEVANVLPYAVTVGEGDIPNILTNSNVSVTSDSNVLELRLDTTVEGLTLSNTSNINITTDNDQYLTVPVLSFSGSNVITIQNSDKFTNVTGAYIHGEHIQDFNNLNKDAIWAVSTAALQEVDRQLQAEKAKVADLLARVTALENN